MYFTLLLPGQFEHETLLHIICQFQFDISTFREFDAPKGITDYNYPNSSTDSSALSSAYSGANAVEAYSKKRIGHVSKSVFDNDEYHKATQNVTPEDQVRGQNWSNIWKSATEPSHRSNRKNSDSPGPRNKNAFSFTVPN